MLLLAGSGERLANFFVPNGLGYDPDLEPYPYDPERARALLAEAGYADGFDTAIDSTEGDQFPYVVSNICPAERIARRWADYLDLVTTETE